MIQMRLHWCLQANQFSISNWHQSKYMLIEWTLNRLTSEWVEKSWFRDNWLRWAWVGSDIATANFLFYVTKHKSIESRYKSKRCKRLKTFLYNDAAKKSCIISSRSNWLPVICLFFLIHKQSTQTKRIAMRCFHFEK